ncbi:outer membrane beta-barrel protein [Campylobacter suis]|uniref:outer membrane beta-barrel protein n=1 Tax=Campylobacter suis TaxID=2790657 RepID=UPI003AB95F18
MNKAKDGGANFGIKGGYDFGSWRAYIEYTYNLETKDTIKIDGETREYKWKSHNFSVNADYTPKITENFKLLVGAYTGFAVVQTDADETEIYTADNTTSWLLGAKVGGFYGFDEHNEVEFGFKAENIFVSDGDLANYGAYIGYNYKF